MKEFIKLAWALFVSFARIISSLAMVALTVLVFYMMWADQDVKNVHVAILVICFSYRFNKPTERKVESESKY